MILFSIIGIPIGVYGLQNINANYLKLIIGIVIIISSFVMFKDIKFNFKNKGISYSVAGFISGIMNGSVFMGGPPIVLFLENESYRKDEFRANVTAHAAISNIVAIVTYYLQGMINTDVVRFTGVNFVILIIGSILGISISKKVKEKMFKHITLILLIVMGITLIIKAVLSIYILSSSGN